MAWNTPENWDYKEAPGSAKLNEQIRDNLTYLKASLPPGVMMDYAGATAPDQWLLCNGAAVSRSTYAALYAAIGVTFGVGDGSTTFNVPDSRGRATIGAGQGTDLTNRVLGATVGAETVSVQHTHTGTTSTPSTTKAFEDSGAEADGARNDHTHTITTGGMSSNNIITIMQPSLVVTKIIKY